MTQQVNLYEPTFDEAPGLLDAGLMLRAAAGLVALLALATVWLVLSGWSERRAVTGLDGRVEAAQTRVDALEGQVTRHLDAAALDAQAVALRSELASKQRLSQLLAERVAGTEQRFSSALRGFARHKLSGLWLTGFELAEGGEAISIRGRALHADLIPRYLQRLGEQEPFRGREFHRFTVQRTEAGPGVVEFEISTRGEVQP